jgi:hypothetical protein
MLFLYHFGFRKFRLFSEANDHVTDVGGTAVSHPIFDNEDLCRFLVPYL